MKVEQVVKKETMKMAAGLLVCSAITQLVFLIFRKYDVSVLLGSLYGCGVMLLNFFLMGITVQNVVKTEDEKMGKKKMQFSYSLRQLGLMLLMGLGMYLYANYGIFHWIPLILSMIYPRLIIGVQSIINKERHAKRGDVL